MRLTVVYHRDTYQGDRLGDTAYQEMLSFLDVRQGREKHWLTADEHVTNAKNEFRAWLNRARRFLPFELVSFADLALQQASEPGQLYVFVDILASAHRYVIEQNEKNGGEVTG